MECMCVWLETALGREELSSLSRWKVGIKGNGVEVWEKTLN